MKSWNCVHQIMKALFLLLNKHKHKAQWYWGSPPQHKRILSTRWTQLLFLCLCSCLLYVKCECPAVYNVLLVSISESLLSCIPISRRFGTENKAIFHSSHAYTSLGMCCSYPHFHYAHICGCCAYVVVKLCIKKIYQCIVISCTFIA